MIEQKLKKWGILSSPAVFLTELINSNLRKYRIFFNVLKFSSLYILRVMTGYPILKNINKLNIKTLTLTLVGMQRDVENFKSRLNL